MLTLAVAGRLSRAAIKSRLGERATHLTVYTSRRICLFVRPSVDHHRRLLNCNRCSLATAIIMPARRSAPREPTRFTQLEGVDKVPGQLHNIANRY